MSTPICDANVINSEPHGFEVVPLSVARDLEKQLAELQALLREAHNTIRWYEALEEVK